MKNVGSLLKKALRSGFDAIGIDIHRKSVTLPSTLRSSLKGCLEQAIKNGLAPASVIDVGVAYGTHELYELFPNAHHLLIEPVEEFEPYLKKLTEQLQRAHYIIGAATYFSGKTQINVHPDLIGSSLFLEEESSDVNGIERTIPAVTLESVCKNHNISGSYLIKLDVQGGELDVLQGAKSLLRETDFVIMEVSLFEFFKGGPQFYDCISFMKDSGFVVYDIFGLQYRLLDKAMSQIDIAFVPEHSQLRQSHSYATAEQRRAQNEYFHKLNA